MWKCPTCSEITQISIAIGDPRCQKDGTELLYFETVQNPNDGSLAQLNIGIGAKVSVGGNMTNSGKIKIFQNGELLVDKNLINTGDITINDPEKVKELLVELVRTTGNVTELGTEVLKRFFGVK